LLPVKNQKPITFAVKAMTKGFKRSHKDLMEKPLKMCLQGLTEFTCSVRDIISDLQKKTANIASIFYLKNKIFKHEQPFLI
jgi:hypothetical protein